MSSHWDISVPDTRFLYLYCHGNIGVHNGNRLQILIVYTNDGGSDNIALCLHRPILLLSPLWDDVILYHCTDHTYWCSSLGKTTEITMDLNTEQL